MLAVQDTANRPRHLTYYYIRQYMSGVMSVINKFLGRARPLLLGRVGIAVIIPRRHLQLKIILSLC